MEDKDLNLISGKILDASIEVHRNLGPGLLESVYETCLCKEFDLRKVNYIRQCMIPIKYKGEIVNCDLKLDILVENEVIIELKAVESIVRVHTAQLLTYLKLAN